MNIYVVTPLSSCHECGLVTVTMEKRRLSPCWHTYVRASVSRVGIHMYERLCHVFPYICTTVSVTCWHTYVRASVSRVGIHMYERLCHVFPYICTTVSVTCWHTYVRASVSLVSIHMYERLCHVLAYICTTVCVTCFHRIVQECVVVLLTMCRGGVTVANNVFKGVSSCYQQCV